MMFESRLRNHQNGNSQTEFFSQNLNIQNHTAQTPNRSQKERKGSFIFDHNAKNGFPI